MQYPLYDYYYASDLTLEEILKHYIQNFYLRKHGRDKAEKVLYKVSDSSKIKKLFEQSAKQGIAPNYVDFGSVINEMMYFMFQSNSTQALAVLAAAIAWDKQINQYAHLKNEDDLRNDTIKIFQKYSMYGDMSQDEYERMTMSNTHDIMENEFDDESKEIFGTNYYVLNFYLDCSYWHKQEDELKKCPLVLPVKIIGVEEEDDIVSKYKVKNLPTLILVDGDGNEIHRWVGVTPTSEINDYISENGYSSNNNAEGFVKYEGMDLAGIPVEFREKMSDPDFQEKVIAILADGGTEDQIREKIDYLLGKKKPDEITALEERVRHYIRNKFDTVGNLILKESNNFDIIHKMKAITMLSKLNNDLDGGEVFPDAERIKEASNRVGISWNLIKSEEYKRALLIYRDGKQVD